MARNGTTAAELLQHRSDDSSRAQDLLDRDPEEALDKLERAVTVDAGAGELTLKDVFTLFMQMQQQQASMQQQIVSLLGRQGNTEQDRRSAHSKHEIAQMQEQQRLTLEAWKTEPRLPVFLQPSDDEKRIFSVMGEFPPRVHRVNGLEFPIKVGEVVSVPESIHAQITWSQGYSAHSRKPAQSIESIVDPDRQQFLASAQSITVGRGGLLGTGPIIADRGVATPAAAGPLDRRYDHEGR